MAQFCFFAHRLRSFFRFSKERWSVIFSSLRESSKEKANESRGVGVECSGRRLHRLITNMFENRENNGEDLDYGERRPLMKKPLWR